MNGHSIDYEHLAKEALRSVVKTVLKGVIKDGLPGEHHFYISFRTTAPGVKISNRIATQYPKEMTIVLQHQFWDLKVEENHFEVRLSFSNIPELLVIPYSAVKVFFDPSVPYGLQFDQSSKPEAVEDKSGFLEESWHMPAENSDENIEIQDELTNPTDKQEKQSSQDPSPATATATLQDFPNSERDETKSTTQDLSKTSETTNEDGSEQEKDSAEIVSLDAFRKK